MKQPQPKDLNLKMLEQAKITKIYEDAFATHAPFPQTFAKLQATKLTTYEVDTLTGEHVFKLGRQLFRSQYGAPKTANKVGKFSRDKAIEVLINHAKTDESFADFLTNLAKAGVTSYVVNFNQATCTYYNDDKSAHFTEHVPLSAPRPKPTIKKHAAGLPPIAKKMSPNGLENSIISTYQAALDGAPYPETFQRLKTLGVNYYVAHLDRGTYEFHAYDTKFYFAPHGAKNVSHVIGAYDQASAKAVIKKRLKYSDFVAELRKAGIREYEVSIDKKTCTYYGLNRINHFVEKLVVR